MISNLKFQISNLAQDVRYGFRMLRKIPGFTAVAIISLALGIGINTAIFSVVNAVLLKPLPYEGADRIVTLWQSQAKDGSNLDGVSVPNFLDWRERSRVFEQVAAIDPWGFDITGQGEPETIQSWLVTEGFFEILGGRALHGRVLLPEEYEPGRERVVVLGYGIWQRRFGGDTKIIGEKLLLDGHPYTVVGVMPPEFQYPAKKEMWAPKIFTEAEQRVRSASYLQVVARLKQGSTIEHAREEMTAISLQLAQEYPQTNRETGASVIPLSDRLIGHVRPALLVLLGAVGVVLLIACSNVANLLLVRGAERQREFAIRAALGAARKRVVRQLLTESLLLALAGGIVGVLLAGWAIDAILALSPDNLPRIEQVQIDERVLAFAFIVSVLTAIIFGLAPAIHLTKSNLQDSLKEGSRGVGAGSARRRLRNSLVVAEIALAMVLLIGAGLLVRSFVRLVSVDPGFVTDNIAALQVFIWDRYRTPERRAEYMEQALESVRSLPEVQAAGAVSALPMYEDSIDPETVFMIEGRADSDQQLKAFSTVATPDYFGAVGIPLLKGRIFNRFDNRDSAPVVVISSAMARRHWPDEDPIGKKVQVRSFGRPVSREIIGVVGDSRHRGLDSEPRQEFFVPHLQNPIGSMTFVVRTTNDAAQMIPLLKSKIWELDKDQPFYGTATMDQLVRETLGNRRFTLLLIGSFALIALGLAAIGMYGLISFSTGQRTHEIGIRIALGARTTDILRMVLGEGVALALIGVGLGLAGSFIVTRFLSSLLFEITPTDSITFASISALLFVVALLASYLPAWRATRVDPVVALRHE